jgi:hypothetical protein
MEARNERLRRNQLEPQDMQVLIASALNSVDGVSDVSKVDGAIAPALTPTPTPNPTPQPQPHPPPPNTKKQQNTKCVSNDRGRQCDQNA